jgi:polar amino acid transport system ATP-binding protein
MEPNIILFDEQTSDLDPELVDEVLDVITDVARSGMTLVIVTHEMGFATKISDKVVFLANGRIEEQGPPSQIFEAPSNPCLLQFLTTWN